MVVKLILPIVIVTACFVSESAFAGLEQNDPGLAELFPYVLTNWNGNSGTLRIPVLPEADHSQHFFIGTNWFGFRTNSASPILRGTNAITSFAERKPLAPGVYLSKPYTCLVIVPDASIDPKMVIDHGRGVDTKMPIIQPEVEYVPWPGVTIKGPSKQD
jgi:hypothetical protein